MRENSSEIEYSKKKKEKNRKEDDVSLHREIEKGQEQQEDDHHSQEENPENNKAEKKRSRKKKDKKRTEEPNMDFDVSLHREIEKQEEDLHPQEKIPHTENSNGEKKRSKKKEKKRKEEPNMDLDVSVRREIEKQQEEDQHSQEENLHAENNMGEKKRSKKKKEKKSREEDPNMDFDVSLYREIKEQERQVEDLHPQAEDPHTKNNMGEKKRSKKKKMRDEHSDEGKLVRENSNGEEKRSKKKKKKEKEKAETPSQKIPTEPSSADHEQRKVKKAHKLLHLAKENGMGEDRAEGLAYEDKKMAKKAKQAQYVLCKSADEEGSNHFVKEDENALSKTKKHSKKSKSSVQRGGYDPASNDDLLSNNIECSKEPLADQIEHVTNTIGVAIDSSPKENEKEKKKERKRKRVTFQDQINVADQEHVRDIVNAACENSTETVEEVWGVRFTPEEDEILKDAVWTYIKSKGWDEQEGLSKVFNSLKHKDARNCWADIKLSLPHRPRQAIRYRAHLLLEKGAHAGKWSEEEEQLLKRLQGEHGRKWKEISSLLERHRTSIKEKWRSLKRTKGKGGWTQGELQQLSDMVHRCLRAKALIPVEKKKPNRRILRDDINWENIADTIGTHSHGSCCGKWYYNLQSSLVTDGLWENEDDFLLLQSLLESGACAEEEVEWDSLLDHRPGQVCSTRWSQMVKHLGENRTRQFLDKLDILARRYAPELLENSVNEISIEDSSIKESPSGGAQIG